MRKKSISELLEDINAAASKKNAQPADTAAAPRARPVPLLTGQQPKRYTYADALRQAQSSAGGNAPSTAKTAQEMYLQALRDSELSGSGRQSIYPKSDQPLTYSQALKQAQGGVEADRIRSAQQYLKEISELGRSEKEGIPYELGSSPMGNDSQGRYYEAMMDYYSRYDRDSVQQLSLQRPDETGGAGAYTPGTGGQTNPPETGSGGRYDQETGQTWYDYDGREVWADLDSLQGVCTMPDGTVISGGTDTLAPQLYDVIVARENGTMAEDEANEEIREIARQSAEESAKNRANKEIKNSGLVGAERTEAWNELYKKYFPKYYDERLDNFMRRTTSYYEVTDITDRLNDIMQGAEEEVSAHLLELRKEYKSDKDYKKALYKYFTGLVNNDQKYDIKEWDEFQAHPIFIYNGELISRDVLGNLLYGYLTQACGFTETEWLAGAGLNQISSGTSKLRWIFSGSYGDDPRDTERIRQGIGIYKQLHT